VSAVARASIFALVLGSLSGSVLASKVRFGARAGATISPDAVSLGGHAAIVDLADLPQLRIEPAVELAVGEEGRISYWMLRFFGHAKYMFDVEDLPIQPFPLVGLEVSYARVSGPVDDGDLKVGLNLGGGVEYQGFAVELFFGIGSVPDVTVSFLYTF